MNVKINLGINNCIHRDISNSAPSKYKIFSLIKFYHGILGREKFGVETFLLA